MELIHEPNRIYGLNESGNLIAEITFPPCGPATVNIDHTFVSPLLRGQGIADRLVRSAVEEIQEDGRKAVVSCSYAIRWFSEHPEFSEVLKSEP